MDTGYEYATPLTVGGAAGTYTLQNPWGPGPCEYALRLISFSAAGGVAVSYDLSTPAVSTTSATNKTSPISGEWILTTAAGVITPAALFGYCPSGTLTLTLTGSSNTLITIHFRRLLAFARMPDIYHINPDTTPPEAIHTQRERDIAAQLKADSNR